MQKLYCYVDESGQDDKSRYFVVVVVSISGNYDVLRDQLMRDESEPLIRLADMWAGCIRGALLDGKDSRVLFSRAKMKGYLKSVD